MAWKNTPEIILKTKISNKQKTKHKQSNKGKHKQTEKNLWWILKTQYLEGKYLRKQEKNHIKNNYEKREQKVIKNNNKNKNSN